MHEALLKVLSLLEVLSRTGLKRSSLYGMAKDGAFPCRFAIAARAVGRYEPEGQEWIATRFLADPTGTMRTSAFSASP